MQNAGKVESDIESQFMVRSVHFAQLYHEQIDPAKEILAFPNGLVPVIITKSGDGVIFAPLDRLLWTKEVEEVLIELARRMDEHEGSDDHLLWVEGDVSELALTNLKSSGWVETSEAFNKMEKIAKQ